MLLESVQNESYTRRIVREQTKQLFGHFQYANRSRTSYHDSLNGKFFGIVYDWIVRKRYEILLEPIQNQSYARIVHERIKSTAQWSENNNLEISDGKSLTNES